LSFLGGAAAFASRTQRKTWRRPVLLSFSLAQPLVWMLFFGFLFERFKVVGQERYLDFLAPGVCGMTVLFGASQSGIGWIRDFQTGFLSRLAAAARSAHPLLAGKIAADVARLLVQALLVLALAMLLGFRPQASWAILAALLVLCLFAAAMSCLSSAFALRARTQEAMAAYVHLCNMPLLFTSTALVPSRQMPDWLAQVAAFNPLSLAVNAWRAALTEGVPPSWREAAPLLVLLALCYAWAAAELARLRQS
jgi:ABC-2 type transport system permease protein